MTASLKRTCADLKSKVAITHPIFGGTFYRKGAANRNVYAYFHEQQGFRHPFHFTITDTRRGAAFFQAFHMSVHLGKPDVRLFFEYDWASAKLVCSKVSKKGLSPAQKEEWQHLKAHHESDLLAAAQQFFEGV